MEYANCEMVEMGMAGRQKSSGKFTCDIDYCPYGRGIIYSLGFNQISECSVEGRIDSSEKGKIELEKKAISKAV